MSKKKTTEYFKNELFNLVENEFGVLGEYINGVTEIEIKHNTCGHTFYVKPKNFLKNRRCPSCSPPKNKKSTTSEFKEKIYNMYKDEYKILGEYINNSEKILVKHNYCGHEYYVRPSNMLRGNKCPDCFGIKSKDTDIFKEEVLNLVGNEYEVLGKYINNNTNINIKHNTCGYQYSVRPASFLKGRRCPKCFGKNKKNTELFKQQVFDLFGDEYEVLGEYVNANTKILVQHNICKHEYTVVPQSILNGTRCPKCFRTKKKTLEQFKSEVFKLEGFNYSVLGDYINTGTKILMKHNECGHEYLVQPRKFLTGRRCPKCFGCFKKTTEQFKQELYVKFGSEYETLGEYINANAKILMRHNTCNHEYYVTPSDILNGRRCPKCFGCFRKSTDEFKNEVFNQVGDEYEVLGEYVQANDYILMRHNTCNYEYNVTPSAFINNKSRCPKCVGGVARTHEEFVKIFNEKYGDEYELLGRYKNTITPILVRHNICNHEYKTSPGNLTKDNHTKCPKCAGNIKKTTEQFKQEVFELVGNEYEVLGEYKNNQTNILMLHNECGKEYSVRPGSFLSGCRCKYCHTSRGERAIRDFLNFYNIQFEKEFTFEDCIYVDKLKFDFAIFKGNYLKFLIEFDGIQHFEPVEVFGGKHGFEETQIRDEIKNKYCKENKITLIRIPYWEIDNIHSILEKKLFKLISTS